MRRGGNPYALRISLAEDQSDADTVAIGQRLGDSLPIARRRGHAITVAERQRESVELALVRSAGVGVAQYDRTVPRHDLRAAQLDLGHDTGMAQHGEYDVVAEGQLADPNAVLEEGKDQRPH